MAIFSLHHSAVGRSTHRAGTAAAHVRYITRRTAARLVLADGMPSGRRAAQTWLHQAEASERRNGRIIDRLMLVLPLELDEPRRVDLVRSFATAATLGRASWLAAIHDRGQDAPNPHVHLVIRDKDRSTGKRVAKLSDQGSTDRLRLLWEQHVNAALKATGSPHSVSRLSLAAQGLPRAPTRHRGPYGPARPPECLDAPPERSYRLPEGTDDPARSPACSSFVRLPETVPSSRPAYGQAAARNGGQGKPGATRSHAQRSQAPQLRF